ncbi:MAG: glycoside hydrolase family 16 protein [Planctomycetota bacterium]
MTSNPPRPTTHIAKLGLGLACTFAVVSAPTGHAAPVGYTQVWADEFNGSSLDTTKWDVRVGGYSPGKRDHTDVARAVDVRNGALRIATWSEPAANPNDDATHYSGRVISKETWTGGYYEARMNFRTVPGMWSAFWLYNSSIFQQGGGAVDPNDEGVEVDIVEHRAWNSKPLSNPNGNISDDVRATLHWNGYGSAQQSAPRELPGVLPETDFDSNGNIASGNGYTGWHTYGVEWQRPNPANNDPGRYVFYFDGTPFWDSLVDSPQPKYDPATTNFSDPAGAVSDIAQWIILSSEVKTPGWAGRLGDPAYGFGPKGASSNGVVKVDWVRVYQPNADPLDLDSFSDLAWAADGGASASTSGDTLTVQTSKNSTVTADLPDVADLSFAGSRLSVAFDLDLSHAPSNTSSSFGIGFADSASGDYFFKVLLDPTADSQGVVFAEGGDSNLGKFATTGFGTGTHRLEFILEGLGNGEIELTLISDLLTNGQATVGLDVLPATTTSIDTLFFEFKGNAWNETFGGNTIVATLTDLTMTQNPEPGTLAIMSIATWFSAIRRPLRPV